MIKKQILLATLITSFVFNVFGTDKNSSDQDRNYVPTEETAIAIAIAVWKPIYGAKNIQKQKPYQATLKEDYWLVSGSLKKNRVGGVATATISRKSGEIVSVNHSK